MIFEKYKKIEGNSEITFGGKKIKAPYDFKQLFSSVYHITHIPTSKYLLEAGKILPQLINDRSILNSERIQVIWLSPNTWEYGSLYGNIRLSYNFNTIIANKRFYAVEIMEDYNPVAFRILITTKDYSDNKLLELYNPQILNNGPWFISDTGQNYYNKNYNIEFMFEDELNIRDATKIDFVKHHDEYCNIYDFGKCPYLNFSAEGAEKIFVSHLVANDVELLNLTLHLSKEDKTWQLLDIALSFEKILKILSNETFEGSSNLSSETKIQLGKSILNLIGNQKYGHANTLSKAFHSKDELKYTIRNIFSRYFDVDDNKLSSSEILEI